MASPSQTRLLRALLILAALAASAHAEDVLVLTNGRKARGEIVEENDERVRLKLAGGILTYPRSMIVEIVRDAAPEPGAQAAPAPAVGDREEYGLLYRDGRRVGTRVFRFLQSSRHVQFEEERVFAAHGDVPERTVRILERCDREFRPLLYQVRERSGNDRALLREARIAGGELEITSFEDGRRKVRVLAIPSGARFPCGARELFARERVAMEGTFRGSLFDFEAGAFRPFTLTDAGKRPYPEPGGGANPKVVDVHLLVLKVGDREERAWVGGDLRALVMDLGPSLRVLASTREVVDRVRAGRFDQVTGPDSAALTRYTDPEGGWSIEKPDPSWIFEKPAVKGAGALLSIRNEALAASVDVLDDPVAEADVTIQQAAESLQRLCRRVATDFRVTSERYGRSGQGPEYWLEAHATTKGERTRTVARVVIRKGRVYRMLGACPGAWFDVCKPELERMLNSLRVE